MSKTIIERIREEKRARQATRALVGIPTVSVPGSGVARTGPVPPEIAFIEAFLTRFSTDVVPMVSRAISEELKGALTPLYDDLRESIRSSLDTTASELSRGLAALQQNAAAASTVVEDDASTGFVVDEELASAIGQLVSSSVEAGEGSGGDDGSADTDLEIPIAELKSELERIMSGSAGFGAHSSTSDEDFDEFSDDQDTMLMDRSPGGGDRWVSPDGAFASEVAKEAARDIEALEDLENLDELDELGVLENAEKAADDSSTDEAEAAGGDDIAAGAPVDEKVEEEAPRDGASDAAPIEAETISAEENRVEEEEPTPPVEATDVGDEETSRAETPEESAPADAGEPDRGAAEEAITPGVGLADASLLDAGVVWVEDVPGEGAAAAAADELSAILCQIRDDQVRIMEKLDEIERAISASVEGQVSRLEGAWEEILARLIQTEESLLNE